MKPEVLKEMVRDWANIKRRQACDILGSPEAGELLADAKKFDLVVDFLTELGHTAQPAVAPTPAVPQGWKLVPVEPTSEMLSAVGKEMSWCNPVGIFRKMLAAAPAAPSRPVTPAPEKWCQYVAGMVFCWLQMQKHLPDEDHCIEAIAGIIQRRLWAYKPSQEPVTLTDEPWYGHKFKEVTRGVWHCECGKTVNEGATPCTNGTQSISTMRRDAVNVDATQMHDAGSAEPVGQGKFTRVDGSRSSLRGSGTQDDPFVADNVDDLAAAPTSPLQEPVTCGNGCSCLVQCGDTYAHAGLPIPREPVTLTDEEIDKVALEATGHDGFGTQPMNSHDLRNVVHGAIAALREKEKA